MHMRMHNLMLKLMLMLYVLCFGVSNQLSMDSELIYGEEKKNLVYVNKNLFFHRKKNFY
jgi:hypothetical protein